MQSGLPNKEKAAVRQRYARGEAEAGQERRGKVENLEKDPNVRIRVDGSIYELTASRVGAQEEFDRFSDAYERKYGRRPRNENAAEAYLFRLAAR